MAFEDFATEEQESSSLGVPGSAPHLDAPAPALPSKSAASARDYPPFDPALDEDLFHFDERTTRTDSRVSGEYVPRSEIISIAEPKASIDEDIGVSTTSTTEDAPAGDELDPIAERAPSRAKSVRAPVVLATSGGLFATRWGLFALATFSIVQAALVFFAWRASDAFSDAVRGARDELAHGRSVEYAGPSIAPAPRIEHPEQTTVAVAEPTTRDIDEWVAGLDSPIEITFRIAEREIEEGEYAAARRRLYAVLAMQDDGASPGERLADARYWIAEAWARESASMVGTEEGR